MRRGQLRFGRTGCLVRFGCYREVWWTVKGRVDDNYAAELVIHSCFFPAALAVNVKCRAGTRNAYEALWNGSDTKAIWKGVTICRYKTAIICAGLWSIWVENTCFAVVQDKKLVLTDKQGCSYWLIKNIITKYHFLSCPVWWQNKLLATCELASSWLDKLGTRESIIILTTIFS